MTIKRYIRRVLLSWLRLEMLEGNMVTLSDQVVALQQRVIALELQSNDQSASHKSDFWQW